MGFDSFPRSGQRRFVAKGPPAPTNFTRIFFVVFDYAQSVTVDFDRKVIHFEDVLLPNKFLTLWPDEKTTVGFDEIQKVRDAKLDGTDVFEVITVKGKAPLIRQRYPQFDELREIISMIFERYKYR